MKFGIYYIPEEGEFYNQGSGLIGYDIRNEKQAEPLDGFDPAWNIGAKEYGFHMTITDAVYIDEDELPLIETELRNLLDSLSKENRYELFVENPSVSFWRSGGDQAALKFKPNLSTMMLHTMLVCLLQTKGRGSLYSEILERNSSMFRPDMVNKTKRFNSPYVLDEFRPHFTLVNPYNGSNHKRIEEQLNKMFENIKTIKIDSLCLVTQTTNEESFRIYKEFIF